MPGPAKYDLLSSNGFGQESKKYTINPEGNKKRSKSSIQEPGPGQYETSDNADGKYLISTLRNTTKNLWSISKTERFKSPSNYYYFFNIKIR